MSLASFKGNVATFASGKAFNTSLVALSPAWSLSKHKISSSKPSIKSLLDTKDLTAELQPPVIETTEGFKCLYFSELFSRIH